MAWYCEYIVSTSGFLLYRGDCAFARTGRTPIGPSVYNKHAHILMIEHAIQLHLQLVCHTQAASAKLAHYE